MSAVTAAYKLMKTPVPDTIQLIPIDIYLNIVGQVSQVVDCVRAGHWTTLVSAFRKTHISIRRKLAEAPI